MNTTPLWVPLVIAGLGLLGTVLGSIGGILLTQRRADRREAEAWHRERERERAQWAREDAARTFDQRRDATVEFYEALRESTDLLFLYEMGRGPLPHDWDGASSRHLQRLQVYGSPLVVEAAKEAHDDAWWWGFSSDSGRGGLQSPDELREAFTKDRKTYDDAASRLLVRIRDDLGIPESPESPVRRERASAD